MLTIVYISLQVYCEWRKVTLEFMKRMDPSLPFYYFTSAHDRFNEEDMPGFNEPRIKPKRDRVPRCELIPGDISRRTSFPVRGSLSIRANFHAGPVNMPPPPSATFHERVAAEHSYA